MSASATGTRARRLRGTRPWAVLCALALLAIVVWPSACDAAASVTVAAKAGSAVATSAAEASLDLERRSADAAVRAAVAVVPDGDAPTVSIHHVASAAPLRAASPAMRVAVAVLLALLAAFLATTGAEPFGRRRARRWATLHTSPCAPGRAPPST